MKKVTSFIVLMLMFVVSFSCPVCERNQPKILKGIVHGAGAESNWDYVGVWIIAVIAVITLFLSIKWLIKPNENNPDHIKNFILE